MYVYRHKTLSKTDKVLLSNRVSGIANPRRIEAAVGTIETLGRPAQAATPHDLRARRTTPTRKPIPPFRSGILQPRHLLPMHPQSLRLIGHQMSLHRSRYLLDLRRIERDPCGFGKVCSGRAGSPEAARPISIPVTNRTAAPSLLRCE